MAATQERDLTRGLPQGAVNPWVLPDMPSYQQRLVPRATCDDDVSQWPSMTVYKVLDV